MTVHKLLVHCSVSPWLDLSLVFVGHGIVFIMTHVLANHLKDVSQMISKISVQGFLVTLLV